MALQLPTSSKYCVVMDPLNSYFEFDDDDVRAFQFEADLIMSKYIKLTGRDGMTNYFHMLHAGHMAEFLHKYKNLYRFSQQGWENLNEFTKRKFHSHSQKSIHNYDRVLLAQS